MNNPIAQIVATFPAQVVIDPTSTTPPGHYFLPQPPGDGVVPLTRKSWSAARGFCILNEPTSQVPVAIEFFGKQSAAVFVLRPGEAIYPGEFDSFNYGIPFGWAGGGVAMLKIGLGRDVRFDTGGASRPEIVYWRTALKVEADAGPLPTLKRNWPSKFPWEYAFAQGGGAQAGTPADGLPLRYRPSNT